MPDDSTLHSSPDQGDKIIKIYHFVPKEWKCFKISLKCLIFQQLLNLKTRLVAFKQEIQKFLMSE